MEGVFDSAFGKANSGESSFDRGVVQRNIQELQQKIMRMTDEFAMLRAEADLKERAEKLEHMIQSMVAGGKYASYSKLKETI
jgi:phage shock protein A